MWVSKNNQPYGAATANASRRGLRKAAGGRQCSAVFTGGDDRMVLFSNTDCTKPKMTTILHDENDQRETTCIAKAVPLPFGAIIGIISCLFMGVAMCLNIR